jgi:hypothetical protein
MALPALLAVGKTRKWTGKPSVTQLLKPTLPSYLEIVNDFTINPMNQISSMIGTNSHNLMEHNLPNGWLSEVRLEDDICSGQFDAVDLKNKTLIDFKFFGSYRIARALGYKGKWTYKGVYQRGVNKGKDKFEMVYNPGGVKDVLEISIQLNYYRKLLADYGIDIDKIKVQMFVRGGVDKVAKSYGIDKSAYTVPIHLLSPHRVRWYMQYKHDKLIEALETSTMPDVCTAKERWSSKSRENFKCLNWCSSNIFCPHYQQNYMTQTEDGLFVPK